MLLLSSVSTMMSAPAWRAEMHSPVKSGWVGAGRVTTVVGDEVADRVAVDAAVGVLPLDPHADGEDVVLGEGPERARQRGHRADGDRRLGGRPGGGGGRAGRRCGRSLGRNGRT